MVNKIFNKYAKYYNHFYAEKNYSLEAKYIADIINKKNPKAKSILDYGCGSGKHAIELAKLGYKVNGIDQSPLLIKEAKKLQKKQNNDINQKINFTVGDIRNYNATSKYDVVISLFHVISYQTLNSDIQSTFCSAKNNLQKDGIFIFDCWYGPAVLENKPENRYKCISTSRFNFTRFATPSLDINKNTVDVEYTINIFDKNNSSFSQITECHKMRYLFLTEIELYFSLYDFKIFLAEEWMTKNDLNSQTWYGCFGGTI